jgi:hypothetical protein
MKDNMLTITVACFIIVLTGIIYLQHLEITGLITKAGAQGKWAQAIDAIGGPIDHMYIEGPGYINGVNVK